MNIAQEQIIFKGLAGSRLFGAYSDTSDFDIKIVFAHNLDGLILGLSDTDRTKTEEENTETEFFSIRKFASLASQNQTIALELLFMPESNVFITTPTWEELKKNRDKVVSKNLMPFIGYARNQARIYSNKGDRLEFLHNIKKRVSMFSSTHEQDQTCTGLTEYFNQFPSTELWVDKDYLSFEDVTTPSGSIVKMIYILGKGIEEFASPKLLLERLDKQILTYGERAKHAKDQKGHDVKATYHAMRVIDEALELLRTGELRFPCAKAELYKAIRRGEFSYDWVCDSIQNLTTALEEEMAKSTLRDTPDKEFINSWALTSQRNYIYNELGVVYHG